MKKIFTLIAALTLSVGLWATSIWSGSQDVHWDNPITIESSKFASALPGNKITVTLSVNDGTNDAIEFTANGQKLPGTRFSLCQDWWETYDLFMTQDMIDSCKVYGMKIYGDNFTVTNIDLSEGKAASMKEGKAIWTGYFWVDSGVGPLEVFKEALTAVKDWSKYSAMRFYSECPTTYKLINLLANQDEPGVIAKSPATNETAGNPLKRYEGYAELDLTKVNPLTVINNVASDRLMIQMDKQQGSAAFNFTDVVLVEQTAPCCINGKKLTINDLKDSELVYFQYFTYKNDERNNGIAGTNPKIAFELYDTEGYAEINYTNKDDVKRNFIVNPKIENAVDSIYQGETYLFADTLLTTAGTYQRTIESNTMTLTLKVKQKPYKYTEYENWQIKYGNTWEWSNNMEKVEDGLFKLEILWEGTGINVKSDENPIKKDWFAPEELVIGEEVIAPIIVDVYLRVIDDETVTIGVGVEPPVPACPTVDATGITVNGRKYGFPVRLVTEAPAAGDPGNGTEQYKNNSNPNWF